MKEDKIIQDWLNGTLNEKEAETALGADVFASYKRIIETSKRFKAPQFDVDSSYQELQTKLEKTKHVTHKKKKVKLISLWTLATVAAASLVFIFILFTQENQLITHQTGIAENSSVYLPDSSEVRLNSNSKLTFSKEGWNENRKVFLNGEAYFNVRKGSSFEVVSPNANTRVLGTRFNVLDRDEFMEVHCYHGSVLVETPVSSNTLKASFAVRLDRNKILNLKTSQQYPLWIDRFSEFKSVSVSFVLKELSSQFPIQFEVDSSVDLNKKYTGKFSHQDLTEALQSFTLPLGLSYSIKGDKVFLKAIEN